MSRKRYTAEQIIAMLREVEERTRYLRYDVNQFKILSTAVSGFLRHWPVSSCCSKTPSSAPSNCS